MKKIIAVLLVLAMVFALAACGTTSANQNNAAPANNTTPTENNVANVDTQQGSEEPAGFEEVTIFEDDEVGFLNVNGVYFQAVPMLPTYPNGDKDNDIHIEADIAALEDMDNGLGFEPGGWVPYLNVTYKITDGSKVVLEGTFMPMSASDGPHYGANIKLDPGKYQIQFSIEPDTAYQIHSDAETGPGKVWDDYFKNGPLTTEVHDFDFPGLEN